MKHPNLKPKQGEQSQPDPYPLDNIQLADSKRKHQDEYDEPADNTGPQPNGDKPPKRVM